MPRFSANLGLLFPERALIERFGAAAAAGFAAVEAQFPYAYPAHAIRAEIDRHGLTMLAINTPLGRNGESGFGAVPGLEDEFRAGFAQALDTARVLGATGIHCMAGTVDPQQQAGADATFVANLRAVAERAATAGLTLLIEPINRRDRPNYALWSVEQAAEIVAAVGRPNVKIQFDCYHTQIMQGDLIRRLERHLPLIGHVQVAAVPSRAEPDEGEVNYAAVYAALDEMGYAGWIGAEYNPRGRTEDGLGWAARYGVVPLDVVPPRSVGGGAEPTVGRRSG